MRSYFHIIVKFLIVSISIQPGCTLITSMQTGRTAGKNNYKVTAGVTNGKYSQQSIFEKEKDEDFEPVFELGVSGGATENLDLYFKANSSTFIAAGLKFQFLGNKNSLFASSIGGESGIVPFILGFAILDYYVTFPLYLSVHPSENLSFYCTPRYLFVSHNAITKPTLSNAPEFTNYKLPGISYGFILGKKHQLILEASHIHQNIQLLPTQFSIGYCYNYSGKKLSSIK